MPKISPLSEVSGYGELISYYEENKDKKWQDWLSFDQTFKKPGKQGLVGLLNLKNLNNEDKKNEEKTSRKYIFKISQYINYLVQHENTIMSGLNDISPFCPHFCKGIGYFTTKINPKCRKDGNPFELSCKYPIEKEVLLCEYVDKSRKFYDFIKNPKIPEKVLYSTIKQILLAISIAQKKKRFAHYDLHSYNIMMKKCNKDAVFLYVLDDDNQFCIPTFGYYPVIIDFGFSYIEDMDDSPLWTSLAHTNAGFMSDRFDWVADPKLFLVTVSQEIKAERKSKRGKKLRRIVRNLFYPITMDWESGWDNVEDEQGAADYITEMVADYNTCSDLFDEYEHYCIDLIQSLIILPLEKQSYENIHKSYGTFLHEWIKIEDEISNPFYSLYILKGLVDAAREVRSDYIHKEWRKEAVNGFKNMVYDRINSVSQFCRPKKINFEIMLCSLLVLARSSEGILHEVIEKKMVEKEREYGKMPVKSIEQIYATIEVNLSNKYNFNKNTTVFVFNCVVEDTDILTLGEEEIESINEIDPLCQGSELYDMYRKNKI